MKSLITTLLITVCLLNTGCIKSLLDKKKDDKKDEPTSYAGVWRATGSAQDADGDKILDENEKGSINGSSELRLNSNNTFSYSISSTGSSPFSMSGNWNSDSKSITITDPNEGSLRFDIKSTNEIHTEPLTSNGRTIWLIYSR